MNTISWLQKISLCSLFKNDLCAYEYTFRKLISSYIISDAVRIIAYQSQNSVTDSLRSMSAPGRVINTTLTSWGLWPEDVSLFQENWPHDGGSRLQTPRQVFSRSKRSPSEFCLPTSILLHDLLCLEGNYRKHPHYISSIWIQRHCWQKGSWQNQHIKWRYNAFGLEVTNPLNDILKNAGEFDWYISSAIFTGSSKTFHLYYATVLLSIWLDRNVTHCFIGLLSPCLGKTQGNTIHMCLILIIHLSVWTLDHYQWKPFSK